LWVWSLTQPACRRCPTSTLNDPEVKGKIMIDCQLSEEGYYSLLAIFNEKNQDIIYRLEGYEVIALLLKFFADHHKKE